MGEDKFMEHLTQRDSVDAYAYWIAGGLACLGLVMLWFLGGLGWLALFVGAALASFAIMMLVGTVEVDGQTKEHWLAVALICALNATAWVIIVASLKGIFA